MKRCRVHATRSAGFTLLELVVGLVISAIVIGFAANLMTVPVEAYFAQTRRSDLLDSSDAVTRTLTRDVGMAVSNSVRIRTAGTRTIVEMLVADVVTFYRPTSTLGPGGPWTAAQRELDLNVLDSQLSVFGRIDPQQTTNSYNFPNQLPAVARYFLVVNNLGTGNNDAYRLTNVITPAPVTLNIVRDPGSYPMSGEEQLNFAPAFRFRNVAPSTSPPANATHRMFLVRGPVAYICNSATGTLRRYDNYAITTNIPANENAAQLNVLGVRNTVLASNVASCRLDCQGAATAAPCLTALNVELGLSRSGGSAGNETARLYLQLPVDNRP